jgi:hypothetical protein
LALAFGVWRFWRHFRVAFGVLKYKKFWRLAFCIFQKKLALNPDVRDPYDPKYSNLVENSLGQPHPDVVNVSVVGHQVLGGHQRRLTGIRYLSVGPVQQLCRRPLGVLLAPGQPLSDPFRVSVLDRSVAHEQNVNRAIATTPGRLDFAVPLPEHEVSAVQLQLLGHQLPVGDLALVALVGPALAQLLLPAHGKAFRVVQRIGRCDHSVRERDDHLRIIINLNKRIFKKKINFLCNLCADLPAPPQCRHWLLELEDAGQRSLDQKQRHRMMAAAANLLLLFEWAGRRAEKEHKNCKNSTVDPSFLI